LIKVIKEFNENWAEIRAEIEKNPQWVKTQGMGSPEYYFFFAEELKDDLKYADKEIAYFKKQKTKSRKDIDKRTKYNQIIANLLSEKKEEILCTIKRFKNIGKKRKQDLKKEETEESQNSLQD
jgi:hypothetical protein